MTQEANKFPPMPPDFWPEITIKQEGGKPVVHGYYKHASLGFAITEGNSPGIIASLYALRTSLWQYGEWYQNKFEAA